MSFNFPDSPTVGQIYEPVLGVSYVWTPPVWRRQVSPSETMGDAPVDGLTYGRKNEAWSPVVGGALISDIPPAPPLQAGQLWYEGDSGGTYIYYDDGNSVQWVQIAGPQSGQQTDYVRKSGDTMTGDLAAANLSSSGIVALGTGGLKFPAVPVPSSDLNTMDAYAEGPWTPALKFGGNSVGMTYGQQQGRFQRSGNKMQVWVWIVLTAKGSSVGVANITGLPVAAATNMAFYSGNIGYFNGTGATMLGCGVSGGNSSINTYNGNANLMDTNFLATSQFMLSVCYEVP